MVIGYVPPWQTLATNALRRIHEYYHLRVACILGHPRSLAVGLLHPRRVRIRALWSLLRLGPRDMRRRQRGASTGNGFDERNGLCLPGMAASGDLAAGRCPKVPQRIHRRIDHFSPSDLYGFLDQVPPQQRDRAEGESAGVQ